MIPPSRLATERTVQIEFLTRSNSDDEILAELHAPVTLWWRGRFREMSSPQRLAVPSIGAGRNVLICAPTGTGKTLCAFISILSDLLARRQRGELGDAIDTVYISPLKALGTDITKNLLTPLSEIAGGESIRVAQRTGDTTARERAALVRKPPHILVTTPESLALCLASAGMRQHLTGVRRIIVDELHSLAANKRGVDLMLSVERLSELVMRAGGADPQRIGLSATIAPLERMSEYLVGNAPGRDCAIVDAAFDRPMELDIASVFGKTTPFLTTAAINRGVYETLERIIRGHRTTLVFTNLRAATERVTYALRKRFAAALERGEEHTDDIVHPYQIEAHHSSLDRDLRLDIERRLKAGELRCVVCSTSLELGIDIGTIDRVVLLNSPKGVARGLQRIGRAGHSLGGIARGTFIPTVPADLIEALVTADAMRKRAVHPIHFPRNCLDVLSQQVVGMAIQAGVEGIHAEETFELVRRSAPYTELLREMFDEVVAFLTSEPGAKLARVGERLSPARKSVAALYAQNVGTITQEGQVKVRIQDGATIGSIEEAFAQVLKPGDRFILAGRCVQVAGSHGMTVEVTETTGQTPTVPRWYSGTMAMEAGLAARVREFRGKVRAIAPAGPGAIARMLTRQYGAAGLCEETAQGAALFLHAQHRYAEIPVEGHLLVERVPDESDGGSATVLVFHTMIGRAANEALARAVAYRMYKRFSPPGRLRAEEAATGATVVVDDYAFAIWVDATTAARRADRALIRSLLSPDGFEEDLIKAIETSDLFRTQFRFTAIRAHALLQNKFGRRRFIGQLQGYAMRLYEALRETLPDHLLIRETRRTIMQDILHAAAKEFLQSLASQNLRLLDLPSPSPFAFGLFATGKRDTLQLADTADLLLAMYRQIQARIAAQPMEQPEQVPLFS